MASVKKAKPTWRDVKAELDGFDRAGLLGLIKDLHGASRTNEAFLSARLGLGTDPLEPYRKAISRWICPDVMKGQTSPSPRPKRRSRTTRRPSGFLKVSLSFWSSTEEALSLLSWCAWMMRDTTQPSCACSSRRSLPDRLPVSERASFYERLDPVRSAASNLGWGVKDALDDLWYSRVETS
jgi:hypothetical protein